MPRLFTLGADASAATPRAARIHALERGLYIVELRVEDGSLWLSEDGRTRAVFHNLAAARAALDTLGPMPHRLLHRSAFDEMIGLDGPANNSIDIVLGRTGA